MKACFIIPVHPPKFQFIYNFLKKTSPIKVFLVFSNDREYSLFDHKYNNEYTAIILNETLGNSPVTQKKWFALSKLRSTDFTHFLVCDSEIEPILENFTEENILSKINGNVVFAGMTNNLIFKEINETCSEFFPDYQTDLEDLTQSFRLYFWFSNIPVYHSEYLDEFFGLINKQNITLKYFHFDYIIYVYFLLIFKDFTITNFSEIINSGYSLEHTFTNNIVILEKIGKLGYNFDWVSKKQYEKLPEFYQNNGTFLKFHLDR